MSRFASLVGCRTCGMVAGLPEIEEIGRDAILRCPGCRMRIPRPGAVSGWRSRRRTAAFALAALTLFPLAVTLPVMRVERLGHAHETGILDGSAMLIRDGQAWLGLIVLFCSVAIPIFKLCGLLFLSTRRIRATASTRVLVWRLVEWSGRWGMLDVLLVASIVALVKIGDLVSIEPGIGAVVFTAMVFLSLLAAMSFDPHEVRMESVHD
ncbi:MAG: paraquat-inducible protein A [Planctomycetota bacterium]